MLMACSLFTTGTNRRTWDFIVKKTEPPVAGQTHETSESIPFAVFQGTIGCTPNSVPIVFIVFSRDSWGQRTHKYPRAIGLIFGFPMTGYALGSGYIQLLVSPEFFCCVLYHFVVSIW